MAIAGDAGVAGGNHAGGAAQGIDAEAGIVGEGEMAGEGGEVAGFFGGIADEGGAVLDAMGEGGGKVTQAGDAEGGKRGIVRGVKFVGDLADLARIGGGDQKRGHGGIVTAARGLRAED